jgi:hypothetical protein
VDGHDANVGLHGTLGFEIVAETRNEARSESSYHARRRCEVRKLWKVSADRPIPLVQGPLQQAQSVQKVVLVA